MKYALQRKRSLLWFRLKRDKNDQHQHQKTPVHIYKKVDTPIELYTF